MDKDPDPKSHILGACANGWGVTLLIQDNTRVVRHYLPSTHCLFSIEPMDPGLHVKQAINHLNKIIAYVPYVKEGDKATVALTPEDWQVTADALFYMNQPKAVFPEQIAEYQLDEMEHVIRLTLEDETEVTVEAG